MNLTMFIDCSEIVLNCLKGASVLYKNYYTIIIEYLEVVLIQNVIH